MVRIWIHATLAELAGGKKDWEFPAVREETEVAVILSSVMAAERRLLHGIIDETGTLRRHINIFVGNTNIRQLEGLSTLVADQQEISIFPAVSGG